MGTNMVLIQMEIYAIAIIANYLVSIYMYADFRVRDSHNQVTGMDYQSPG